MIKVYLDKSFPVLEELSGEENLVFVDDPKEAEVILTAIPKVEKIEADKYYIVVGKAEINGDNIFEIKDSSIETLELIIGFIEHIRSELRKNNFLKRILKKERQMLKEASTYVEESGGLNQEMTNKFFEVISFANELSSKHKIDDIVNRLNQIFSTEKILFDITLLCYQEKFDHDVILIISDDLFLCANVGQDRGAALFYLMLIADIVASFFKNEYRLKLELDLWEAVFEKITPPVAVFSQNGELLLHNTNFLKLKILPNACVKLNDGDKIEREENVYLVKKIEIQLKHEKNTYFVFTNELQTSSVRNISAQELGIISGSVAHELNNPLAGIIAAVSVLQLDDEFNSEDLLDLNEMKQGAQRCKQLVEIFLGFSKRSIGGQSSSIFKDALDRSLNLLRFRMIESNVRVEISISDQSKLFGREINVSVISMIFYLIFSEIITQTSHHRLITNQRFDNIVRGTLCSFSDRIELVFEDLIEIEDVIKNATLITNLIQIEGLSLDAISNRVLLS